MQSFMACAFPLSVEVPPQIGARAVTAAPTPSTQVPSPSAVVSISEAAKSLDLSNASTPALQEARAPGTAGSDKPFSGGVMPDDPIVWYDPIFTAEDILALEALKASAPLVALRNLSGDVQMANYEKEFRQFTIEPKQASDRSLRTVSAELVKLQALMELTRPSILGASWDFVLKDQRIEVLGDQLSTTDRQWLENALNRNDRLVSAVERFYGSVVKYYEHTPEHASGTVRNWSTGQLDGFASNVAEQINGKLAVRDVMDKTIASFSQRAFFNRLFSVDERQPFANAVEFVTRYIKVDDDPAFRRMTLDLSDPTTAQYVQAHPKWWL